MPIFQYDCSECYRTGDPILFLIAGPKCKSKNYFACKRSMKCISNDYLCDGRIQCGEGGEDEDFDLCKSRNAFAERANISCIEKYRPTNQPTRILATYCDTHIECQNSSLEEPLKCLPGSGKLQNKYNIHFLQLNYFSRMLRHPFIYQWKCFWVFWLSWPLSLYYTVSLVTLI